MAETGALDVANAGLTIAGVTVLVGPDVGGTKAARPSGTVVKTGALDAANIGLTTPGATKLVGPDVVGTKAA